MILASRRALLLGAAIAGPAAVLLSGCTNPLSFAQVQSYVATADAALDKLAPIVEQLDPAITPQLQLVVSNADAAAAAFAALTSPASAGTLAKTVITLIEDGLTIAEAVPALPPSTKAILGAVELLLVTVASFFNVAPPVAATLARAQLRAQAKTQYDASADKARIADAAQARVNAWLAQ